MRAGKVAIALCTLLVSSLALTACDENGLPTEAEMQEFTQGVEQFSGFMKEFNANMEEFTDGLEEFSGAAKEIQESVEAYTGQELKYGVDDAVEFAENAEEWSKQIGDVVDTLDQAEPIIKSLNKDVSSVAKDLAEFYDRAEIEDLIEELNKLSK